MCALLAEQARPCRPEMRGDPRPGRLRRARARRSPAPASPSRPGPRRCGTPPRSQADWTMAAITGAAGLPPTLAAIRRGGAIALANKEALVCAGDVMLARSPPPGAALLPVDSEHNAIFQCDGRRQPRRGRAHRPHRLGRARSAPRRREEMAGDHAGGGAAPSRLVDGRQDHHRFRDHDEQGPGSDRGRAAVRPAERGRSRCWCIRNPWCTAWSAIATAACWRSSARPTCASRSPMRWPGPSGSRPARQAARSRGRLARLDFFAPDAERFPALALAREALQAGGGAPTILNAANEVAVAAFLAAADRLPRYRRHRGAVLDGMGAPPAPDRSIPCSRLMRPRGRPPMLCILSRAA